VSELSVDSVDSVDSSFGSEVSPESVVSSVDVCSEVLSSLDVSPPVSSLVWSADSLSSVWVSSNVLVSVSVMVALLGVGRLACRKERRPGARDTHPAL